VKTIEEEKEILRFLKLKTNMILASFAWWCKNMQY